MSKRTEIEALIQLLDDNDPAVFENVSNRLISFGKEVIPTLETVWEEDFNPALHERIENLIHQINFEEIHKNLKAWKNNDDATLLDGALIVAQYHFADLKEDAVDLLVSQIKQKIWLELHDYLTPLEQVNVFNHIFYGMIGFEGSYTDEPETRDYCINYVLESKHGNSISLGLIYLIVAHELQLPIYGVVLHKHFILSYQKRFVQNFEEDLSGEAVFYINPMNKGMVFQREEIKAYLKSMDHTATTADFSPADNKTLILELLKYMIVHFERKSESSKIEEINTLMRIFE